MDYAFYRVTKDDDGAGFGESVWMPLDKIISIEPSSRGSTLTYVSANESKKMFIKESAEDIFNSVVFVKSPSTYYVDPTNGSI